MTCLSYFIGIRLMVLLMCFFLCCSTARNPVFYDFWPFNIQTNNWLSWILKAAIGNYNNIIPTNKTVSFKCNFIIHNGLPYKGFFFQCFESHGFRSYMDEFFFCFVNNCMLWNEPQIQFNISRRKAYNFQFINRSHFRPK